MQILVYSIFKIYLFIAPKHANNFDWFFNLVIFYRELNIIPPITEKVVWQKFENEKSEIKNLRFFKAIAF